jgi:hypothetical protein
MSTMFSTAARLLGLQVERAPIERWAEERVVRSARQAMTPIATLREDFRQWCAAYGVDAPMMSKAAFARALLDLGYELGNIPVRSAHSPFTVWHRASTATLRPVTAL